ncbi:MAG: TetR/AcrR family transcriptional regulator [Actinomycetota bacterium]|nr:TetR/AcrR family transcriptional regulator [Actinomycetota bacterium]
MAGGPRVVDNTRRRKGKPGAKRVLRSDSAITRQRVLDAAIECILENGYYKTSSNEIARRAGVTWGALQYQFGTREALLLEVVHDRWQQQEHLVAAAEVAGRSLEERLESVMKVLSERYGRPEELAHIQILLDLAHNPEVSEGTRLAVARHQRKLVAIWRPLFEQALGDAADDHLIHYAYNTIRGYLLGGVISKGIANPRNDRIARRLLIEGLAATIRAEAKKAGKSVP